jgi:hypothetical protein
MLATNRALFVLPLHGCGRSASPGHKNQHRRHSHMEVPGWNPGRPTNLFNAPCTPSSEHLRGPGRYQLSVLGCRDQR